MNFNYPEKPIWNDDMKFRVGAIAAVKEFKKNAPKNTCADRFAKLCTLCADLNKVYGLRVTMVWDGNENAPHSFESCYSPMNGVIHMNGKLSIITFLHEYAHALGRDEEKAVLWSLSLFKRTFPIAFEKLNPSRHCLVQEVTNDQI